jgi:hypothetical protein
VRHQADSDDKIAKLMADLGVETADELPAESVYQIIKDYRPLPSTSGTNAETVETSA